MKAASFTVICSILMLIGSFSEIEAKARPAGDGGVHACSRRRIDPTGIEAGFRRVNHSGCPYGKSYETPRQDCCCDRRQTGYICINKSSSTTTTETPST